MKITHKVINIIGPMPIGYVDDYPSIIVDGGDIHKDIKTVITHLGDFDSAKKKPDIILDKLKDYSDFTYALSLLNPNVSTIHAHGFLGGRPDHEFGNFLEAYRSLENLKNTKINFYNTDSLCQTTCTSPGEYEFKHKGTFSIFSLNRQLVTLEGDIDYKLNNSTLNQASTHGLSNKSKGLIKIKCMEPLLIFFNYN